MNKIGGAAGEQSNPQARSPKLLLDRRHQVAQGFVSNYRQSPPLGQRGKVQGQMPNAAPAIGDGLLQVGGAAQQRMEQPPVTQHATKDQGFAEAKAFLLADAAAQLQNDFFQIDLGRTDCRTGPTADAGLDQLGGLLQTVKKGREHHADSAHIGVTEDMAADGLINGTDVGTGAAAEAAQSVLAIGSLGQGVATVVEEHDMQLLGRPLLGHRSANPADVGGQGLGRGATGQQLQHPGGILQGWHQLVDADQYYMHRRQSRHQPGIALVGQQRQSARFGYGQISAADAHVGLQKLIPQLLTGHRHQVFDISRLGLTGDLPKKSRHFVAEHVNGRHHHVTGALTGQLHDPFAEVRLQSFDPSRAQGLVKADLLAGHALALDRQFGPAAVGQLDNIVVGSSGIGGTVHLSTGLFGQFNELI